MTFAEIAGCTDEQIADILFHPRHDDGSLDLDAKEDRIATSFRDTVFYLWRKQDPGASDAELEERFKAAYPTYRG